MNARRIATYALALMIVGMAGAGLALAEGTAGPTTTPTEEATQPAASGHCDVIIRQITVGPIVITEKCIVLLP